ncbi:MAG: PH domain-containing protein [Parasphingopyxis sp.]|nr:PH domain-containing protein [Sphingomonadales bacterium]
MSDDQQRPESFERLDPRQKWVIRIHTALIGLVPAAALGIADLVLATEIPWQYGAVSLAVVLLYLIAVTVFPGRRYRRWGYQMGEEAIRIVSGWIFRKDTVVPFARVQHIDVSRGPIERMFGVATLTLHTAGSYNSTVALPGLAIDDANRMREEIRRQIGHDLP